MQTTARKGQIVPDTEKQAAEEKATQLRIYQGDEERTDADLTPETSQHVTRDYVEEFWAGRNHAMRRSARRAA